MTNLKNKVALITGGSSGIGAATAKLLEEKGARVFCAQRTKSLHENILIDLKDNNNLKKIISEVNDKAGRLDILINKWVELIVKNPDLDVSAFFLSLDNQVYAEIRSDVKLSAASSIKVPILIILLAMLER